MLLLCDGYVMGVSVLRSTSLLYIHKRKGRDYWIKNSNMTKFRSKEEFLWHVSFTL